MKPSQIILVYCAHMEQGKPSPSQVSDAFANFLEGNVEEFLYQVNHPKLPSGEAIKIARIWHDKWSVDQTQRISEMRWVAMRLLEVDS